jgi:hypothetical protein
MNVADTGMLSKMLKHQNEKRSREDLMVRTMLDVVSGHMDLFMSISNVQSFD